MAVNRYNLPPLNALKTFEAFGRYLNLREAADELCVTQSAVSRQLKQLEDHLDCKLLERVGRSTVLTDVGKRYLEALTSSLSDISQATDELFPKHRSPLQKQVLKISVGPVFAEYWLMPRLPAFYELHPDIHLEIQVTRNQLINTPTDRVDVEIFTGGNIPDEFEAVQLIKIIDFAVCSPDFLAVHGPINSLDDLLALPLLHEGSTHWWPAWLKNAGCEKSYVSSGSVMYDETLCLKMALAGQGVALADQISAHAFLESGQLVKPLHDAVEAPEWVNLITHRKKALSHNAQCFKAWLIDEMQAFKQLLDG